MKNNFLFVIKFVGIALIATVLVACISAGPKTEFYSLFPSQNSGSSNGGGAQANKELSIGIGPVILPEYATGAAIVSFSKSNTLRVAGYDAWAGNLEANLTRVIASNVSQSLGFSRVQSFPWDTRARPSYQLRLYFDDFGGVRGDEARVDIRWVMFDIAAKKLVASGLVSASEKLTNESAAEYVRGLNDAVNAASSQLAKRIAENTSN